MSFNRRTLAHRLDSIAVAAPHVFFFGLFPFYFGYHALLGAQLIPPFLGGAWSAFTVPGAVLLGAITALRAPDWRVHIPALLLAIWVGVYAILHFLLGAEWQRHPLLLIESIKLICTWGCLYALGYLFKPTPLFLRLSTWALAGMAFAALFLVSRETLTDGAATYLGFATSVVFVSMFCLALAPDRFQPLILAVATAALFALGSRSDFVGFILVIGLWLGLSFWRGHFSIAAAGMVLSLLALLLSAAWTDALPPILKPAFYEHHHILPLPPRHRTTQPTKIDGPVVVLGAPRAVMAKPASKPIPEHATRQLELATPSKSQSFQIRAELMRKGLEDIKSSPLLGVYGGQMREPGGEFGHYIHNALSVWHQFGLVPFLIYLGLCAAPALVAVRAILMGSRDPVWVVTLYIGAFTLLLATLAKSIFWAMPALAWGLMAARITVPARLPWAFHTPQTTNSS